MSFLSREGDTVPWWWPGVVRSDQKRRPYMTEDELIRKLGYVVEHPVPFVTAMTFVAVPYVVGGMIVVLAPPPWKPVGVSMMVPGPSDPLLFAAGYSVGMQIEDMFD